MRLNSQPSHIVSFLPGITTCVRWGRGDGVRESPRRHRRDTSTGSTTPRPHVPVQQVRRPVGLAPRPRHEADGVVLAPAAPLLAEAALGDAGHFAGSPRSSRRCWWFAPRRAGWVLARERCGRCNCACCCFAVTAAPALIPLANSSARSTGAVVSLISACGTSTGRQNDGFGSQ